MCSTVTTYAASFLLQDLRVTLPLAFRREGTDSVLFSFNHLFSVLYIKPYEYMYNIYLILMNNDFILLK